MSLLVDTNIVINAHHRPHLLSAEVTKLLQGRSQVRFSAAVPWEIAVKAKLGKFPYPMEPLLATLREEHFHGNCSTHPLPHILLNLLGYLFSTKKLTESSRNSKAAVIL
jgi:PIN domain nuclease of toxin-antitoxin system